MLNKFTETLKDYLPVIGHKMVLQWVKCWVWNVLLHFFKFWDFLKGQETQQLRIRTVCWCHYIYINIYIQRNLVIRVSLLDFMRLFTWFNPLGDSEADRDDFSYSLKSLFKSVYQTGNRDTNGLINSTIPFATSI